MAGKSVVCIKMADSSSTDFENDPRMPCKYGEKCYQKNAKHREKFKHLTKTTPKNGKKRELDETSEGVTKKQCLEKSPADKPDGTQTPSRIEGDEEDLPASPQSLEENIKQKFLTEMPDDFYSFWEFCKSLDSSHPEDALLALTGLQLVGPYEVLSGKIASLKDRKLSTYLTHYRYYYDPPEFQTVLKGPDDTQYHIGYFRDCPDELPVFVAENEALKSCTIRPVGENIFAAVCSFVDAKLKNSKKGSNEKLVKLKTSLEKWAKNAKFSLEKNTTKMKARSKKVVTKSFHSAGIVVPYDKKTEAGYRELPETDAQLKKIMQSIVACKTEVERDKKFSALQEIITLIQFANDEQDYGMGLELAMDLFCFGDAHFHPIILCLLPLAYDLLKRPQFAQISKAHIANRSKSMSEISHANP